MLTYDHYSIVTTVLLLFVALPWLSDGPGTGGFVFFIFSAFFHFLTFSNEPANRRIFFMQRWCGGFDATGVKVVSVLRCVSPALSLSLALGFACKRWQHILTGLA